MLLVEKAAAIPTAFVRVIRDEIANEVERRRLPEARYASGVIIRGARYITIGKSVFFDHRAYINCNTVDGEPGSIRLGDNVEIGPYSILWGGGGITIGNDVHLGAHVHVTSMEGCHVSPEVQDSFTPLQIGRGAVVIGDHVLICSNSVVVPGVTIGHHVMVAAGAVVTQDVPPYALVAGVPARVIRSIAGDHAAALA